MSEDNKIRKHCHGNPGVIAVYGHIRIKLSGTPGTQQLQFKSIRKNDSFHFVPPNASDHALQPGPDFHIFFHVVIPQIQPIRAMDDRKPRQIPFNANPFNFLYPPFEIPWAVRIP